MIYELNNIWSSNLCNKTKTIQKSLFHNEEWQHKLLLTYLSKKHVSVVQL